jgi:hypothetical protein
MIEEDKGTDHGSLARRQTATDSESTQVPFTWVNDEFNSRTRCFLAGTISEIMVKITHRHPLGHEIPIFVVQG